MKTKKQSAQVPVAKLQNYLAELSTLLAQTEDNLLVRRTDDGTTSIRLGRGQYLTISLQKGVQP